MTIKVICDFLGDVGISVRLQPVRGGTFIDGVDIDQGGLIVDAAKVKSGDILHEAGHLAVVPQRFRQFATGDIDVALRPHYDTWFAGGVDPDCPITRAILQAGEAEAMAWSFAAARAAGIAPDVVFHEGAYGGDEGELIAMLSANCHFGINGLQHAGMTTRRLFPAMSRWLQT
jgi:hypothetical protein